MNTNIFMKTLLVLLICFNINTNSVVNSVVSKDEVLDYTNTFRKEANKKELVLDDELSNVAYLRAKEIAHNNMFSHTRPNGTNFFSILDDANIKEDYFGENIGKGYDGALEVSNAWRDSHSHYDNIIDDNYSKLGVGIYTYNGTTYWVQLFTS